MGAEYLCHQVIFVEDAASAVTPLDPEMIQISNAVGQGAERRMRVLRRDRLGGLIREYDQVA